MKRLITILIVVIIVTLLLGGVVYAYQVLWSGKAEITIEESRSGANIDLLGVSTENSIWDESSKIWTISIHRGETASLILNFRNIGGDATQILMYIDGEHISNRKELASNVYLYASGYQLAPSEEHTVYFMLAANVGAESGTLPDVALEVRY